MPRFYQLVDKAVSAVVFLTYYRAQALYVTSPRDRGKDEIRCRFTGKDNYRQGGPRG